MKAVVTNLDSGTSVEVKADSLDFLEKLINDCIRMHCSFTHPQYYKTDIQRVILSPDRSIYHVYSDVTIPTVKREKLHSFEVTITD